MALSVTSWPQSFASRVVYDDAVGTTVNSNCTGSTGVIQMVIVDNTEGDQEVFLKMKDGISATVSDEPDWLIRTASGKIGTVLLNSCGDFSGGLSFWACRNATVGDSTAPSVTTNGTVKVTIIVEQTSNRINNSSAGY